MAKGQLLGQDVPKISTMTGYGRVSGWVPPAVPQPPPARLPLERPALAADAGERRVRVKSRRPPDSSSSRSSTPSGSCTPGARPQQPERSLQRVASSPCFAGGYPRPPQSATRLLIEMQRARSPASSTSSNASRLPAGPRSWYKPQQPNFAGRTFTGTFGMKLS
uniref:Uncharacterized protein n=1 Tax=Alexandrium monilatum TaxID=311494 RepID=A0A7S4UT13_9DINO